MCGICGIISLRGSTRPDRDLLRRMIAALRHRGPDGSGGFVSRRVALGHSRLAVIDPIGGAQPMSSEDGGCRLVFNGEIFNYLELRDELLAAGHRFRTRSDTEVLLRAWQQWDLGCLERLNGQYAFAVWEQRRRRLVLVRDRVGILPLYWARSGQSLLFASEIKALLQDRDLPRRLDLQGLAQTFTFWAPLAPRTAFAGVQQLRPGSFMELQLDDRGEERRREQVYWRPAYPQRLASAERGGSAFGCWDEQRIAELAEQLRERLEQATRLRMLRADVPVGVYLSGGLDSSLLAALVRRFHRGPLSTFSLRFAHPEFDEGAYQQQMIGRLNSAHSALEVDYPAIARSFPNVVRATEAPVLRTAPAPLFLLSELVRRQGCKVVLTGEGADELLAGYDLFREDKIRRFWARQPDSTLRPLLLQRLYPWLARSPARARALQQQFFGRGFERLDRPYFSHIPRWESTAALQRLFSASTRQALAGYDPVEELAAELPAEAERWEPLARAQYLEVTTLLSSYLLSSQGDRMLMGHSVEGRFPYLDHEVMDFANSLPPEAKLRVLDEKHLLKRVARDLLPEAILSRPKQPYRAPDAQSFVQDGAPEYVGELLSEPQLRRSGVFREEGVRLLMAKCRRLRERTPSNTDNMAVVGVISTQLLDHLLIQGHGLTCEEAAEPELEFEEGET